MSDSVTLLRALDQAGFHLTAPRRAVAQMVAERAGRFSADDLLQEARRTRRGVGRATIFRSLAIFEALGLVESMHLPNGEHAYVVCEPVHHHHLVCERCGRSTEVGDVGIAPIARAIERQTGFVVDSHRIEFFGICPACRAAEARAPKAGAETRAADAHAAKPGAEARAAEAPAAATADGSESVSP